MSRQGEVGLAVELAGVHAVEAPGCPRRGDVVLEVRRLPGELGRRDHQFLQHQRNETPPEQRHGEIADDGPEAPARQVAPQGPDQDHRGGEQGQHRRAPGSPAAPACRSV